MQWKAYRTTDDNRTVVLGTFIGEYDVSEELDRARYMFNEFLMIDAWLSIGNIVDGNVEYIFG